MPGEILCPVKTTKIVFPILCLEDSVPRDFVPTNNYFVPGKFCAQRFSAWKGDSVPQKSILCPGDFVPREILCLERFCAQWIFPSLSLIFKSILLLSTSTKELKIQMCKTCSRSKISWIYIAKLYFIFAIFIPKSEPFRNEKMLHQIFWNIKKVWYAFDVKCWFSFWNYPLQIDLIWIFE